ncbi:MAG: alpha/beta hydrolase [Candidatus Pelagadaptatus aseana]|uniref:alpha/beta hydrolase fold domain-containing protein n=1 Tax=Candidatus Pelagadaptatus aseana TaxID=3120508 RepID=UPI0039B35995
MDWILALLAAFNTASMATVLYDRRTKRIAPPWTRFAYSLITTELAWLWLPTQMILALLLCFAGALQSGLGLFALLVLIVSWGGLVSNIKKAFMAEQLTEEALQEELGNHYLQEITPELRHRVENHADAKEWLNPFKMQREDVEVIKDIAYGPNGVRQHLDIYRPKHLPKQGCPVLLQIHGGAWTIGTKDSQALPLMQLMASKGWICVAINYRLSPSVGFPTHLEDCKRALCWIKTQGQEYGMNPDFVAVTGGSAGGHLTSLMGLTANMPELQQDYPDVDTSLQAVVPFYGVYDVIGKMDNSSRDMFVNFLQHKVIFDTPEDNPELWDLASPVTHLRPGLPPFMMVQGQIDSLTTVAGARLFHQRLKQQDNTAVYLELLGAEHAFDTIHSPRTDAVIKGVHRFLEWSRSKHLESKQAATETKTPEAITPADQSNKDQPVAEA